MRRFGMTSVFANPGRPSSRCSATSPAISATSSACRGLRGGHGGRLRAGDPQRVVRESPFGGRRRQRHGQHLHRLQEPHADGDHRRAAGAFDPSVRPVPVFGPGHRAAEALCQMEHRASPSPDVPLAIARAYYLAMMPPCGPVLVSVPVDDWDQHTERVPTRAVSTRTRPEPELIARISAALEASERPAFVVGAAADRDGAWNEVVHWRKPTRARVWVAPMSGRCSFPEDHRLFAGFLPAMRERIVELLEGHDLILAIGAPAFAYHVEGTGPHVPAGAALCQLTEDPDTAAWAPVGISAVGSIRLGLLDLLAVPPKKTRPLPPREGHSAVRSRRR
ncbi:thiamine pyrophosphate enzyme, central domain-containing protein [Ditylenchus destructor]|uniref:Thiamine pyrophosphate enzyme, central domain-containing protein n=1 Tax=Ditylenchus destructor TaxID=166010 RepID=A0AAD4MKC1_9BILA|nr:thiamine pyrophosphate enzyme, central domain-containing protein [Ditylenchus destructor]